MDLAIGTKFGVVNTMKHIAHCEWKVISGSDAKATSRFRWPATARIIAVVQSDFVMAIDRRIEIEAVASGLEGKWISRHDVEQASRVSRSTAFNFYAIIGHGSWKLARKMNAPK